MPTWNGTYYKGDQRGSRRDCRCSLYSWLFAQTNYGSCSNPLLMMSLRNCLQVRIQKFLVGGRGGGSKNFDFFFGFCHHIIQREEWVRTNTLNGLLSARQRNVISMPFRWLADDGVDPAPPHPSGSVHGLIMSK